MNRQLPSGLQRVLEHKILICPHCGNLLLQGEQSVSCASGHSFDVARQGYVNLMVGAHRASDGATSYSADFVEARRTAIERGFFAALVEDMARYLETKFGHRLLTILDAGSGEGSFLDLLARALGNRGFDAPLALGVDLAVPGVKHAASRFREMAWCVADLAKTPCRASSLDVVLNILSPANYAEFARILKPDGLVIKVVPTASHLREIRAALRSDSQFSNARVVEHFGDCLKMVDSMVVESVLPCGADGAAALFHMTPLSWHATEAQKNEFVQNPPEQLTVSFEVLVGVRASP